LPGTSIALIDRYRRKRGIFHEFYKRASNYQGGFMAIPTLLAPFHATFVPDPDEGYQFTFLNPGNGTSLNNAFFVPDEGGTVEITLTNATFYEVPIVWSIPPGETPTIVTKISDSTISFKVPAPEHLFSPWVFRIIANPDGNDIKAVRSQNIYLVKDLPLDGSEFTLRYLVESGNFALLDSPTASLQDGLILENTLAMINTMVPVADPPFFTFTVKLETIFPTGAPDPSLPTFNSSPVVWGTTPAPTWITAVTTPPDTTTTFTLLPAALGQSVSLQFSLNVPTQGGGSITVLSPDPIIMNATIGDG
jgi:hypothetical protein